MNLLNKVWNRIQYAKLRHRVNQLPEKQQIVIGQKLYEEAYDVMKMFSGDELGACSVVFDCPYSGHVAYHILKTLDERSLDLEDPTVYASVEKLTADTWVATAVVKSNTQQNAITTADACVMSAILKSNTVAASFTKYLSAVDLGSGKLPEKEKLMKELHSHLGETAA